MPYTLSKKAECEESSSLSRPLKHSRCRCPGRSWCRRRAAEKGRQSEREGEADGQAGVWESGVEESQRDVGERGSGPSLRALGLEEGGLRSESPDGVGFLHPRRK